MPKTPAYEELQQRVRALEHAEREREAAWKREKSVRQVLQSVRKINRLMVAETDPYGLIRRACEHLTGTPGYLSAWIALLDRDGAVKMTASSGWKDFFEVIQEGLEQGRFPVCVERALEKDEFVLVRDPASECLDCPLSGVYQSRAGLIRRLSLEGKVYGVLCVAVPHALAQDGEMRVLFNELARDLAFALKRIEDSETLRLAHEIILRSPAVAFVWEKAEGWPVRFASENTGRLFGWTARDFMSGAVSYADVVFPEDLERVFREVAKAEKDPAASTIQHAPYRIVRRDGEVRWVEDRTFIQRRGKGEALEFQGILLDVTDRMRAEEVSETRRVQLRSLFENSGEAIALLDPENRIQEVNGAFERVFGFSPKEAQGKVIEDLICPERFYHIESKALDQMSLKGIKGMDLIRKRRDGREIHVRASAGPIKAGERLLGRFVVFDDITEHKRIEEEARAARAFLTSVLDNSPFPMWVSDREGMVIQTNRALRQALNLTDDRILGAYHVLQDGNLENQGVMPLVLQVFEKGVPARFVIPWNASDVGHGDFSGARDLIIDVAMYPIESREGDLIHVVCQWVDITERKRAEEALRRSRAMLARTEHLARIGSWEWEIETDRVTWSEELFRLFLMTPAERAPSWAEHEDLYHPDDMAMLRRDVERAVAEGTPYERELRAIRKDGETRICLARGFAERGPDGRIVRLFGSLQDVTERKRVEAELRKYQSRLEEMVAARTQELRDAQEALVRKEKLSVLGRLAGGVGHELRNPLGAIKSAVYFLNMALESPEEEVRDTLAILNREVRSSEKIIQALFDYADPKGPKRIDGVDLNALIRGGLDRIPVPENVAISQELDDALPAARVDPDLIEQVIRNLVRNGIQAMRQGGRLLLETKEEPANRIRIRVSDTGAGIPKENLNMIFEPLFTTRAKGIGLGLALSRGHVEAHGGTLEVESGEGKGTTFTVRLPVNPDPVEPEPEDPH